MAAAVLQQPIGSEDNQELFFAMFDQWADGLKEAMPSVSEADWRMFRSNMFGGDFLYNVDRDFVARCATPLLVLMGSDPYHPEAISREIARLAPRATLVEQWKDPARDGTVDTVVGFLRQHTPA